jgi:hypothetical protein
MLIVARLDKGRAGLLAARQPRCQIFFLSGRSRRNRCRRRWDACTSGGTRCGAHARSKKSVGLPPGAWARPAETPAPLRLGGPASSMQWGLIAAGECARAKVHEAGKASGAIRHKGRAASTAMGNLGDMRSSAMCCQILGVDGPARLDRSCEICESPKFMASGAVIVLLTRNEPVCSSFPRANARQTKF